MSAPKRGLGRGLEALLIDIAQPVIAKENLERLSANSDDEHTVIAAITLMKAIQKENANLINEVHALKELLADFEALVQNLNIDKPIL